LIERFVFASSRRISAGAAGSRTGSVGTQRALQKSGLELFVDTYASSPAIRQGSLAQQQPRSAMSKLMIVFVLLVSGALYDPQRVMYQLGPEASAVGWKIASTLRLR
jgi:hypothetical protein